MLLTPTLGLEAFAHGTTFPRRIGDEDVDPAWMDWAPFLYDANLCGYPALSLPIGFGDDGLPIAMHVLGRRGADGLVLGASATIEAIVGTVAWPPDVRPPGAAAPADTARSSRSRARDFDRLAASCHRAGAGRRDAALAGRPGLRLPMVDYDGWSYHLVTVDVWLQANELVRVPQRIWTDGNPSNGEVLTTWLMAFERRDALAGFTSILPIPVAIVATAGLARRFGASRRSALLCCLIFGMTPAMIALAGTSYVDASSVAAVLASWYLGLRWLAGDRDWPTTLLLASAAGIAAGTKFTGFLLVGPMLVAVGLVILAGGVRAWRGAGAVRPWLVRLAVLVGPVVVFGGIWYLKNLFIHGNPLYPVIVGPLPGAITLAGMTIDVPALDRLDPLLRVPASWAADWGITRYNYNERPGGFGRAWLAVIPFAIAGLYLLARDRRWLPIGLVLVPAAITLVTMPENWYARLTLFVPGLALALTAVALDTLRSRPRVLIAGSLLLLAALSLVIANVRPNVDIRAADGRRVSPLAYIAFVLQPSAEERQMVGLMRACIGFRQVPPGDRVVPGGFNLLHGVVGPDLDRILTDPLPPVSDVELLIAALDDRDAQWMVTNDVGAIPDLAASAPDRLKVRGDICRGARLWERIDDP